MDLYNQLLSMGYEVMLDDRKDGYGTKMKDAELIGIPINVIVGKQYLQNNEIELQHRDGQSSTGKFEDILTIFEHYKSS
jgi:prolyl-tRNA synthetase